MNKKMFAGISKDGNPARFYLLGLALALSAGVFTFDLITTWSMVCTIPYVFLVLVGLWMPRWYIMSSAFFGTALTFLGHGVSMNSPQTTVNSAFCLVGIWVTAVLCKQFQRNTDALAEKSTMVHALVDNALDGKMTTDDSGNIKFLNASAERMFGYAPNEVNGKNISLLIFDEQSGGNEAGNGSQAEDDKTLKLSRKLVEAKGKRKNGSVFPLELVVSELFVAGQRLFIAAVRDISQRKQAENELRTINHKLQLILDSVGDGVCGLDSEGKMTFVNPAAARMLGYASNELEGAHMHFTLHHSKADGSPCLIKDCSIYDTYKRGIPHTVSDDVFWRKDGSCFPVEYTSAPVIENRILGAVVMFRDIMERKQTETALREAKANLEKQVEQRTAELQHINKLLKIEIAEHRLIAEDLNKLACAVEQSPSSVIITDTKGTIEYVNPKFTQLTGYTFNEAFGKNPRILKSGHTPPETYKGLWETICSGGEWHGEFHNRKKGGGTFWGLAIISAIKNPKGVITHFLSLMEDITERKQLEEELKITLAEKELLLKEVHHRTKNNMQVISSLLRLQSRHIPDKKYANMFQESFNRIRAMSLIYEKVYKSTNLASVDAGEYITSLTQAILGSYGYDSGKVALKIDTEEICLNIDAGIPVGLIINELVSNTLKHAFPDERTGTVEISLRYTGPKLLELIVRDDGVGVPEGFDFRHSPSLGLQLVVMQAENQLRGQITLERNNGILYKIEFEEK